MNNRFIGALSAFLGLAIAGFTGAAFLGILTLQATSGVVVALFAAQLALLGADLLLQSRKISAFIALIPAAMGLLFAFLLFF